MYLLYSLLLAVGFVAALPYFAWKGVSGGKYVRSFRQRWNGPPADLLPRGARSIWVHAVSVGEVLASRPLLRALRERWPDRKLVLSTTTLTGHGIAQRQLTETVDGIFYAPFDWTGPVSRVLERVRPEALVLMETELWPNLIHESHRRGVRVAVVNGRLSPRSARRYRRIRWFLAPVLAEVDLFAMQAEAHAARARDIGAPAARVRVLGNLKYDALEEHAAPDALRTLVGEGSAASPLWVAGSTAPGEESQVLEAFAAVRHRHPAARLVIAPRHPERFSEVAELLERSSWRHARRSELAAPWRDGDVLLLDTLGELAGVLSLADVAFVGGSLVPYGGHNVLEAAVAGVAVVVGPHMENFQEIADEFGAGGGLIRVASAVELADQVSGLLGDPDRRRAVGERARALVAERRGAARRTVEALAELLP